MKKILKTGGIILAVLVAIAAGVVLYLYLAYPDVEPASTERVEANEARLARGKYLAHHVTVCIDCHSTRDWSRYSGPIVAGTFGKGGEKFDEASGGIPGIIHAGNITPAGIGAWSDGELMRCITNGVTKDGRAIFPLMPYMAYNKLTKEDLHSLVVYIRTLAPLRNSIPEPKLNFPMNLIVRTIPPKSYTPPDEPNKESPIEYGKYLATIAACGDCHTPAEKGKPIAGMEFAGGFEFQFPGGTVRSANISSDIKTGIGAWTKEQFIRRFKSFAPDSAILARVDIQKDFNTPMPWTMYAGMTEKDLGAIFDYLRTQKNVSHVVEKFTPRR